MTPYPAQSQPSAQPSASRRSWLLWLGPLPLLSATTALAITSGGQLLRGLLLGGALWMMTLPLLYSLEAGMVMLMLFEPLRGFLRRAQFIFVEYTATDPIHLVTPLITVLAFTILLWRRRERIFVELPLALPVTILAMVFLLQVFNPSQGGLFVGMSGALFILLPVTWFYFGQAIQSKLMGTALRLIVLMAILCSLHGMYQTFLGYPDFESYWIKNTDHYESIAVGHIQRAIATFSSAEEWGRYVQNGTLIACGLALGARSLRQRIGWALAGVTLIGMLILTGQRTAIFGLLVGLVVLLLLGARNWLAAAGRVALMLVAVGMLTIIVKPPSVSDVYSKSKDAKVETMLSHTLRGTLQPTKEASLEERFFIWNRLITKYVPARPWGTGLGIGTVAAARNATVGAELYPIDSFVAILLVGCSLPAALLFLWILARAQWLAIRIFKQAPPESAEATVRRIVASIIPMLIVNSFFGLTFTTYSSAPIGWLVLGWACAEAARDEQWLASTVQDS